MYRFLCLESSVPCDIKPLQLEKNGCLYTANLSHGKARDIQGIYIRCDILSQIERVTCVVGGNPLHTLNNDFLGMLIPAGNYVNILSPFIEVFPSVSTYKYHEFIFSLYLFEDKRVMNLPVFIQYEGDMIPVPTFNKAEFPVTQIIESTKNKDGTFSLKNLDRAIQLLFIPEFRSLDITMMISHASVILEAPYIFDFIKVQEKEDEYTVSGENIQNIYIIYANSLVNIHSMLGFKHY